MKLQYISQYSSGKWISKLIRSSKKTSSNTQRMRGSWPPGNFQLKDCREKKREGAKTNLRKTHDISREVTVFRFVLEERCCFPSFSYECCSCNFMFMDIDYYQGKWVKEHLLDIQERRVVCHSWRVFLIITRACKMFGPVISDQ